jgi:large repetitive protein
MKKHLLSLFAILAFTTIYSFSQCNSVLPIWGGLELCIGQTRSIYETEQGMTNYIWTVSSGGSIVSGQGTYTIQVQWNNLGIGNQQVSLTYTDKNNCTPNTPTIAIISVFPYASVATPNRTVISGQTVTFTTEAGKQNYRWYFNLANSDLTYTILSGGNVNDNFINVRFNNNQSGYSLDCHVSVYYDGACGGGNIVSVYASCPTPVINVPSAGSGTDFSVCSQNRMLLAVPDIFTGSYQWIKDGIDIVGATSNFYLANSSGDYAVKLIDGTCSITSQPYRYIRLVDQTPVISVNSANNTCQGIVALSVNPIQGATNYAWIFNGSFGLPPSADPTTYNATQSGTYTVRIGGQNKLGQWCFKYTDPIQVAIDSPLPNQSAQINSSNGSNAVCAGSSSYYSYAVIMKQDPPPIPIPPQTIIDNFVYTGIISDWSLSGTATGTIISLPPSILTESSYISINWTNSGNATLTLRQRNSCGEFNVKTLNIIVNSSPPSVPILTGPSFACQNSSQDYMISNPEVGTTYTWSADGASFSNQSATSVRVTFSNSNHYQISATPLNGNCTNLSGKTFVSVGMSDPPPLLVVTPVLSPLCPASYNLSTDDDAIASKATYEWILNGNMIAGAISRNYVASVEGNYSVRRITGPSCSSISNVVEINDTTNPILNIDIVNGNTVTTSRTFCQNTSISLKSNLPLEPVNWYKDGQLIAPALFTFFPNQSGSYWATGVNGCNRKSNVISLTFVPLPIVSVSNRTVCSGTSFSIPLTSSQPGSTFSWSIQSVSTGISGWSPGSGNTISQTLYNSSTTDGTIIYRVNVVSVGAVTCQNISDITVTVSARANAIISSSGSTNFCQGGSVTLTASTGSSYLWSTGATTPAITVSTSGNYSVTVTNANNCATTSAATTVTVNPLPTATITTSGATTFCQGGSVTLTASAGSSFLWSTGVTTQAITVSASGNYSVTVKNANNCSATSTVTTVTVNPSPATPTISTSGATTFCQGGSVNLSAPAGYTYSWSTGATSQAITVSTNGNYSVTIKNASNCSATSVATSVTVNPSPATPTIAASGATTICQGGSVTLTASTGSSYLWSTGATTQIITVSASGSYSVAVSNASGCAATSAVTVVTVNPLPTATISASGPVTFCQGGSVTLTASTGASYKWANSISPSTIISTSQSISLSTGGSYFVTVTNSSGCSLTSSTTTVTVTPVSVSISPSSASICSGSYTTLSASGLATYSWSPSTGLSATSGATVNASPTSTTTYTVSGTTAGGCAGSKTVTVTVSAQPSGGIIVSPSINIYNAGYANLSAPLGTSYAWSTGATSRQITVYSAGSYSVYVTNGGCGRSFSVTVTNTGGSPCGGGRPPCYLRQATDEPSANANDEPDVSEFSVFPNPAVGQFTVALPERVKDNTPLTFYDMLGKELISSTIPKGQWKVSVSLENISEGMYLVKIGYGHTMVKKVMVKK